VRLFCRTVPSRTIDSTGQFRNFGSTGAIAAGDKEVIGRIHFRADGVNWTHSQHDCRQQPGGPKWRLVFQTNQPVIRPDRLVPAKQNREGVGVRIEAVAFAEG